MPDLLGRHNPETPWKEGLARLIFVSDMGDALSTKGDFPFLKSDLMPAIRSDAGKRHLWLWLTKRPGRMAEFAEEIDGFPENVCAMTTLTGPDADSLQRLADLKKVKASMHGLSIEPLWDRIPPSKLNLKGIDWVILGGESGSGDLTRPFALEWIEELRDHCQKRGVAFFLKQLGRNPSRNGDVFRLKDKHGGDWEEWDESLRIREFPKAFHDFRREEMVLSSTLRPIKSPKKSKESEWPGLTAAEKADFKRLDKIVRKGVTAFMESGNALMEIQIGSLSKAGGYDTWENYCREVAGLSKSYAHRLIQAVSMAKDLTAELPIGNDVELVAPRSESQVRPLRRLEDPVKRSQAWEMAVKNAGGQPTAENVINAVFEILSPENPKEKEPTKSEQRTQIFGRLKTLILKRGSWDQVEKLFMELEKLL